MATDRRRRAARRAVPLVALLPVLSAGACGHAPSPQVDVADLTQLRDRLAALRGAPAIVNYWATWCVPCLQEMPDLVAATRAFRERGGQVLGVAMEHVVDVDDPAAVVPAVQAKMAQVGIDFPVVVCTEEDLIEVRRGLGIDLGALPQTFAYDRSGLEAAHHEGRASRDEFDAMTRAAER